jgi:putative ABC transport system permease protein
MGALPKDIFKMILIETTLLCSLGGILGIALSFGFSGVSAMAIRYFLPFVPDGSLIAIDWKTVVFAFVSITLIGIVGGVYPAGRAAMVRPLDSIRSE